MPEPTTTPIEEWKNLSKIIDNANIEQITKGKLRFVILTHNVENEEIYSLSKDIFSKLTHEVSKYLDKISSQPNIREKIKLFNNLYLLITLQILISKLNGRHHESSILSLINISINKMNEIKNYIETWSLVYEPISIKLYNTFELFELYALQ